jgi:tol-pal system protein YbgF
MQTTLASVSKQFTEFRAGTDTRLEQVVNATSGGKAPPVPETADGIFAEAMKRYDAKQWLDARRLFDAFINRFGADGRASKAQYLIGESYLAEAKYANAIGAFTKVIDNFPKSEIVPDAMFRNGQAFRALKYCGDARIYFQELLRRYPKTEWKKDASDELKKLQSDAKNKSVCQN